MSHKIKPISEQVIVITGASSGIGLATAHLAAQRGAKVVLVARNLDQLKKTCEEITASGGTSMCIKADVSSFVQLQKVQQEVLKTFGSIDTWVNNAGTAIYGKLLDLDLKEEKRLFDVNFWGIRNGCHLAVDAMKKEGGVIINLGSEVSDRSLPLLGLYSATKQAVKAYSDALRLELADDEIPVHVCLIRPTSINTPFPMHAANRLRHGVPTLPGPVYDPEIVAEAILTCAVVPQRDVYVGGPSKITSLMESVSSILTDNFQEKVFKKQIGRGEKHPAQESLFNHPKKEGDIHGQRPVSEEIKSSPYTTLSMMSLSSIGTKEGLSKVAAEVKKGLSKESKL